MKIMSSHKKEKIYEGYKTGFRAVMTLTLKPGIIFAPGFNICTKQTVKTCKNVFNFHVTISFNFAPVPDQFDICTKETPEIFIPILTQI